MSFKIVSILASDRRFSKPCIWRLSLANDSVSEEVVSRRAGGTYFGTAVSSADMGGRYGFSRILGLSLTGGDSLSSRSSSKSSSSSSPPSSFMNESSSENSSNARSGEAATLSVVNSSSVSSLKPSKTSVSAFLLLFLSHASYSSRVLFPDVDTKLSSPVRRSPRPSSSKDFGSLVPFLTPSFFSKAAISASSSANLSLTFLDNFEGGGGGGGLS